MTKPKLKSDEKFKIESIKAQIESEKFAFDRYLQVIVRSAFIDCCTGGAYFNKMYTEMLLRGYEILEESKVPKEKKEKLRIEWFPLFWKGETEVERWKSNLKYHKRLTNWAKYLLNGLDDKKKEEIIKDSIEQEEMWSEQFNRNSKLYDALNPKKKPVKKVKKKK